MVFDPINNLITSTKQIKTKQTPQRQIKTNKNNTNQSPQKQINKQNQQKTTPLITTTTKIIFPKITFLN
ncbi:MAG: hypothetical protein WC758_00300 [Candidatus Woesearchaeota archaeon]